MIDFQRADDLEFLAQLTLLLTGFDAFLPGEDLQPQRGRQLAAPDLAGETMGRESGFGLAGERNPLQGDQVPRRPCESPDVRLSPGRG